MRDLQCLEARPFKTVLKKERSDQTPNFNNRRISSGFRSRKTLRKMGQFTFTGKKLNL